MIRLSQMKILIFLVISLENYNNFQNHLTVIVRIIVKNLYYFGYLKEKCPSNSEREKYFFFYIGKYKISLLKNMKG